MQYQNLLVNIKDHIATVTINRPRSLNSLNSDTITELDACFSELPLHKEVQGIILVGSGDKAFIAGADISELAKKDPISGRDFALAGQQMLNKIEQCPKPVIAAINGFALGGGCETAMACHLRIAAAHAKFGQPEVGLGIIPGFGGTQRLPRIVGKGRALELLLGGGMIDAAEAFRIGLANIVIESCQKDAEGKTVTDEKGRPIFDRDGFIQAILKMLKGLIEKGPIAHEYIITAVNRGLDVPLSEALRIEADLFGVIYATEDTREGLNAFLEKRKANFQGK